MWCGAAAAQPPANAAWRAAPSHGGGVLPPSPPAPTPRSPTGTAPLRERPLRGHGGLRGPWRLASRPRHVTRRLPSRDGSGVREWRRGSDVVDGAWHACCEPRAAGQLQGAVMPHAEGGGRWSGGDSARSAPSGRSARSAQSARRAAAPGPRGPGDRVSRHFFHTRYSQDCFYRALSRPALPPVGPRSLNAAPQPGAPGPARPPQTAHSVCIDQLRWRTGAHTSRPRCCCCWRRSRGPQRKRRASRWSPRARRTSRPPSPPRPRPSRWCTSTASRRAGARRVRAARGATPATSTRCGGREHAVACHVRGACRHAC